MSKGLALKAEIELRKGSKWTRWYAPGTYSASALPFWSRFPNSHVLAHALCSAIRH